jgi:hypothetical protein
MSREVILLVPSDTCVADRKYDAIKRRQAKHLPQNPAPRGRGKNAKTLTLRLDGESFEWVPRE